MPLDDAGLPALTCTRCNGALKGARPDGAPAEKTDNGRVLVDPCEGSGTLWTAFWSSVCDEGSCMQACPKLCSPAGEFQWPVGVVNPEAKPWLDCIDCIIGPENTNPGPFEACKADK